MCTGTCSRVVGAGLWPFALLCIVGNLLLAFPNWKTEYVQNRGEHLTPEVLYLGGIVGGGIMVRAGLGGEAQGEKSLSVEIDSRCMHGKQSGSPGRDPWSGS